MSILNVKWTETVPKQRCKTFDNVDLHSSVHSQDFPAFHSRQHYWHSDFTIRDSYHCLATYGTECDISTTTYQGCITSTGTVCTVSSWNRSDSGWDCWSDFIFHWPQFRSHSLLCSHLLFRNLRCDEPLPTSWKVWSIR